MIALGALTVRWAPPHRHPGDRSSAVGGWGDRPLGRVQAADREIGRQTAVRARAVAEFAASRPSSADRQPGEPGCASAASRAARPDVLAPVSEWEAPGGTEALGADGTLTVAPPPA
ncbi:MAG TPA: hypothetical protein VGO74_14565 [Modestobacter sp.]|nr:hypothetical protein [Modestobacter sp.]